MAVLYDESSQKGIRTHPQIPYECFIIKTEPKHLSTLITINKDEGATAYTRKTITLCFMEGQAENGPPLEHSRISESDVLN